MSETKVAREVSAGLTTGQFGPVMRGGTPPRPWYWQAFRIGVVVLAIGALVAVGTAGALLWYGQANLQRVEVAGLGAGEPEDAATGAPVEEITDVLNVLLVGVDSRKGLSREELRALGTDDTGSHLTDTIILLQLDPRRDAAAMLSFPRDLYIERCDGTRGKINAAYNIGQRESEDGPSCLVETIEGFTGLHLDHYVEVDLRGFIDVVDAIGGVSLYLDDPLKDRAAGLDLPEGCVTMDGKTSLGFVRARHIDNDFGRIARQQRFAREVVRQMTAAGTLVDVPKLFRLVGAVARAVHVDRDLSLDRMRRVAFSLRDISSDGLLTRMVPGDIRMVGDQSVVMPDDYEARLLFRAFRTGAIFPADIGTSGPDTIGVEDVPPVTVLNGTTLNGRAAAAAEALEERGFGVAETGNAERSDFDRTQVVYPRELQEEAQILAEVLDGASLVLAPEGEPITVVIGADFDLDTLPEPSPQPSATGPGIPTQTYRGAEPSRVTC